MPRIVHFDIQAPEPEKLVEYYSKVFGWEMAKWDGPMEYWLVTTGSDDEPGINGGLAKSEDGQPRTVTTVEVDSIDDYLAAVTENGGAIAAEKGPIPGVGWFAMTVDPQGSLIGLMQPDPEAG